MSDDPVAILECLLTQEPRTREVHYLKVSRDFFDCDWTYEEMGAIEAEFARDFRVVATHVGRVWGAPAFIGHRRESAFPEFHTIERLCQWEELCYWRRGDALALVWWEHTDKEVPVALALAALTPEYGAG